MLRHCAYLRATVSICHVNWHSFSLLSLGPHPMRPTIHDIICCLTAISRYRDSGYDGLLTTVSIYRWTFGSLLFISSFGAVMGPRTYVQHLTSGSRLPFTAAYFGSIALTIYFSVGVSIGLLSVRMSWSLMMSASKHCLNPGICTHTDCMSSMVPGQLLPYGLQRSPAGYHIRC